MSYIDSIKNDGQFIVGFANLEGALDGNYKDYNYGLIIAKKLDDGIIDSARSGPNFGYLDLYNDVNRHLAELVGKISEELNSLGVDSMAIKPTVDDSELSKSYEKTLRTGFSHKLVATRAGIGWIGKTSLLVTKKFGPRVRLATVLMKEPIGKCGTPINKSRCGSCKKCVEACPVKAANGVAWDVNTDRDKFLDPFKCRAYCKAISKENIHKEMSLCGICVAACPIGRRPSKLMDKGYI